MSNWKDDKILVWIDVFSKSDSSFRTVSDEDFGTWQPRTKEEQAAFGCLVAEENRQLLRLWYARFPALDGRADLFRRLLEHATGEKLPLGED
jgi:hypothetical protein